jgi:hypothetical protein
MTSCQDYYEWGRIVGACYALVYVAAAVACGGLAFWWQERRPE